MPRPVIAGTEFVAARSALATVGRGFVLVFAMLATIVAQAVIALASLVRVVEKFVAAGTRLMPGAVTPSQRLAAAYLEDRG